MLSPPHRTYTNSPEYVYIQSVESALKRTVKIVFRYLFWIVIKIYQMQHLTIVH